MSHTKRSLLLNIVPTSKSQDDFIENNLIEDFIELDKNIEYDIYAKVLFHNEEVINIETTFMDLKYETIYEPETELSYEVNPYETYTKHIKGEGQVILALKEIKPTI